MCFMGEGGLIPQRFELRVKELEAQDLSYRKKKN